MIDLKNEIDKELEFLTLSDDFIQNTMDSAKTHKQIKRKKKRVPLVAAAMLAVLLVGTTGAAGYYLYQRIQVNDQVLPELDSMTLQEFHEIEGLKSIGDEEFPEYELKCKSYNELKNQLKTPLLDTPYSRDASLQDAIYTTDKENSEKIEIKPYITGDTTDVEKEGKICYYSPGKEFFSPINLRIWTSISEEDLNKESSTDYLGGFEFVEQYVSKQGYKVNIVASDCEIPSYYALFVADGIQYELSGQVKLDKMKEIIDSMSYN